MGCPLTTCGQRDPQARPHTGRTPTNHRTVTLGVCGPCTASTTTGPARGHPPAPGAQSSRGPGPCQGRSASHVMQPPAAPLTGPTSM